MKYLIEVIYYVSELECPVFGFVFDQEEGSCLDIISLGDTVDESMACRDDATQMWEEYLRSIEKDWEYGVLYKTVLAVTLTYSTDYWGDVDCDWDISVLAHHEYSDSKETKLTLGGIL